MVLEDCAVLKFGPQLELSPFLRAAQLVALGLCPSDCLADLSQARAQEGV